MKEIKNILVCGIGAIGSIYAEKIQKSTPENLRILVDKKRLEKYTKNPVILFMGVAAFILCGFEHCIADMFYFSIAKMWSREAFLCILVITLGNSLGGIFIPLAKKLQ